MPAVALISIDGFSAALAADPSARLPALRGLAARGVSAGGLRPAFPSVTWSCHTTLITGVVVGGDHGFVEVGHRSLPNDALRAAGLLRVDAAGHVVGGEARVIANGGSSHVYVAGGRGSVERTREVLAAAPGVGEVLGPESFADLGLPQPEQDPTQGDLVPHAAEGWFFTRHATPELAAAALPYRGTHGHRPDDPRLHAGFIAAGPSIMAGARVAVLDQLDVAPPAAAMLGLRLPTAERAPSPLILRGS